MTQTERQVLEALLELEDAVARMQTETPKPNVLPIFSRIEELSGALPATTDPQLLHYLRKKSYQKARLFLQGRETESGTCHGHVE